MTFSANWLSLREPYDLRARNRMVLDAVASSVADQRSVSVVDLACGTGSTLRALAPHLPMRQKWLLADNDLGLLARAGETARPRQAAVTTAPIDLARDLEAALDGPVDLVTTSALIDLVSKDWLERLVVECVLRAIPLYAALSYDGRMSFEPSDPADARMLKTLNAHQRTDKGFGPALGADAANAMIRSFERVDYEVTHGRADWVLSPADADLQLKLCTICTATAQEVGGPPAREAEAWLTRRREAILAGVSRLTVGHVDVFARPKIGARRADRSQSSSISSASGNIRIGTRKA